MKPGSSKFILTIICILFITANAFSQQRCHTMEAIKYRMEHDKAYREDYEKKLKDLDAYISAHPTPESFATGDTVIIPVVVHVVLPNPNIITDDNVDYFIKRLNTDYSGFNADSANGSSFYGVRGHSLLRFALARRDMNGNSTTGVERRVGTGTIKDSDPQPIKDFSSGGLAPWDITKYYNLWVGVGSGGLLGISPEIGPGTQSGTAIDGICCDYQVFANNPCFSQSAFAMARTSVHEIGHNMGLYHTFDQGCTGNDFQQLSSTGMALPSSLLSGIDDTPPIKTSTSGCPAQGAANGCTPSVPKMFQNYMDYTDDACYSMFTNGQVKRMHYVVEHFRAGYLTTKGHLPPDGTPLNEAAANSIVSPGGSEIIGCNSVNYPIPTCGTGIFTPKLRVTNFGVNNLTTITVNLLLNNNLVSQTFTTNLLGARSDVFELPQQTLQNGLNHLKFYTSNPNGVIDSITNNDTLSMDINFAGSAPPSTVLPINEGFENAAFNPTINGWTVDNKTAGTNTFVRTTAASKTGAACTMIQLFGNTATGDYDYLKSPYLYFNNTSDSVFISFDYAYKLKNTANSGKRDTLSVEVATDCTGSTWTSLWKNAGNSLRTVTTTQNSNWTPTAAEWTTTPIKVSLWNYKNTPVYVALKTRNGNGQNIFIDNINIYSTPVLPVKLTSFTVQQNTRNVLCKWETKQEENMSGYNIERSVNGKDFESIGFVKAAANIISTAFYSFADENAYSQNATTLYYRLKLIDLNGKYSYSNIVFVKFGEKQSVQLYPNPANNLVNVQIISTSAVATNTNIQVVDYLGRVVINKKIVVNTGTQTIELNTQQLQAGNYIVVIKNSNELKTLKLIKQ